MIAAFLYEHELFESCHSHLDGLVETVDDLVDLVKEDGEDWDSIEELLGTKAANALKKALIN